jgi:hypothetical protein
MDDDPGTIAEQPKEEQPAQEATSERRPGRFWRGRGGREGGRRR